VPSCKKNSPITFAKAKGDALASHTLSNTKDSPITTMQYYISRTPLSCIAKQPANRKQRNIGTESTFAEQ